MEQTRVEQLAALAARRGGAPPVAVLPAKLATGGEFALCAFQADGPVHWLVIDESGEVLRDRRRIREIAELIAICETAEEAASALAAEAAVPLLAHARSLADELGEAEALTAAVATLEAVKALAAALDVGVRVAEPGYLDELARHAALVGDRFDLLKTAAAAASARISGPGDPLDPLAEALWDAVRLLARDGLPDRFAASVEAGMGAVAALADDVESNYLALLADEPAQQEEQRS